MTNGLTAELANYLALNYETTIEPSSCGEAGPCFVARHPALSGCMSHGATPEEALANLRKVRELYLSTLLANGVRPPLPACQAAMVGAGHLPADPMN